MANVPNLPPLPQEHPNLSNDQEMSERALARAERDNREFYEQGSLIANDVTFLQTGVNEQVAHALTRNARAAGLAEDTLNRVKEEKVQVKLYRAVAGMDTYETELGEDSKNYLGSENVDYQVQPGVIRMGRQVNRVVRGAGAMIGTNNYIESRVAARFGDNRNVDARRDFVIERLRAPLTNIWATAPAQWALVETTLNLLPGSTVQNVMDAMEDLPFSGLRNFRDFCALNAIPINQEPAFWDLMLLVYVDQQESADFSISQIYDHERLRQQWNNYRNGPGSAPGTIAMTNAVINALDESAIFPLENNPENILLLSELRARMYRVMETDPNTGAVPANVAGNIIAQEIANIVAQEVPEGQLTPEDRTRIGTCRTEITPVINESANSANVIGTQATNITNLNTALRAANRALGGARRAQTRATNARLVQIRADVVTLNGRLPAIDANIAATNASIRAGGAGPLLQALSRQLTTFTNERKSVTDQIAQLQQEDARLQVEPLPSARLTAAQAQVTTLTTQLNQANTDMQTAITALRNAGARMTTILRTGNALDFANNAANVNQIAVAGRGNMNLFDLLADPTVPLDANIPAITLALGQLQNNVINRLEVLARPRVRMTPFTLVQRLMRRDYMREQLLDPDDPTIYNEEANHYANIKAGLRLADIKSLDLMRSANQDAADFLNRGLVRRGWDNVKRAVAHGQDFIGLEPIDFQNMTADKLLESLINSREEFSVFRGIGKFTTVRDLRHILNQTGRDVSKETITRFLATLEAAITKFKKVKPTLAKGLDPHDWDLGTLLVVFRKLKVEMWSRELLNEVDATNSPRREQELTRILRGSRQREREVEDFIFRDIDNKDAMWRVQLSKNELKKVLKKETLDSLNEIKRAGIEQKRTELTEREARLNGLPENSPERAGLTRECDNLRNEINVLERQIRDSTDLYQRVEKAKTYIEEHDLSRKQKKAYLETVGLTQVFDKMSTNFWAERTWKKTKKASSYIWDKTKKGWTWGRKSFLNTKTAKSVGGKTLELGRIIASPVTTPLEWAYKVGMFGPRMIGRAMSHSVDAPWWLAGQVSKAPLRRYYRERAQVEVERMDRLITKRKSIINKLPDIYFNKIKKWKSKDINRLEEQIYKTNADLNEIRASALKNKVDLGELATFSEVANDNGEIIIKPIAA